MSRDKQAKSAETELETDGSTSAGATITDGHDPASSLGCRATVTLQRPTISESKVLSRHIGVNLSSSVFRAVSDGNQDVTVTGTLNRNRVPFGTASMIGEDHTLSAAETGP